MKFTGGYLLFPPLYLTKGVILAKSNFGEKILNKLGPPFTLVKSNFEDLEEKILHKLLI